MKLGYEGKAPKTKAFQRSLLRWFGGHRRSLPWRDDPTPYKVWISEIMLQQTQVKTVVPYFNRFLERFPDLESLAKAPEEDVVALWSGLGYYSRARNLHRAARIIVEKHARFPNDFGAIRALPGIGRYTAGAICSIAFNQAHPVVDGNVRRVITRLKALRTPPPASYFWDQMTAWIPQTDPSAFNQAMMELGATICIPISPRCNRCPVEGSCEGRKRGIQNEIPLVRVRPPAKRVPIAILALEWKGKLLLTSANKLHIVPGKWGLPFRQIARNESPEESASQLCLALTGRSISLIPVAVISHSISNHRIHAFAFYGKPGRLSRSKRTGVNLWIQAGQEKDLLLSSLYRKVLQKCLAPATRVQAGISQGCAGLKR